jgi:hypothetical protein
MRKVLIWGSNPNRKIIGKAKMKPKKQWKIL